eukprot:scpid59101/ scgid0909/ 
MSGTLIFKTGTKDKVRLIIINGITEKLGQQVCKALIGMHAFTGCDSNSSFYGKGKKVPLELVKKDASMVSAMAELGSSLIISQQQKINCEAFVCQLYRSDTKEINFARYMSLAADNPQKMPPTKDALIQHTLRANYQAYIWKAALVPCPSVACWTWMDTGLPRHPSDSVDDTASCST